ncbi:hypothetical protein FBU31_004125 [Coemansia sp. 'formosensis']|nr:hypothetical protein FBU31_004125 [Coemansia sp. 'formosensis']
MAHNDKIPWSTCLVLAPDAPQYRLCVGNQLAPMTAGRLTHRQGEQWVENQFLVHFTWAQQALSALTEPMAEPEVLELPLVTPPAMQPTAPAPALVTELAVIEPLQECASAVPQPEDKYKQE